MEAVQDGEPWPDPSPIPNDLPPVEPFHPKGLLPESFVSYVSDVAERMQCPVDYPGVALVVVLAGLVGVKVGIRPKRHDDWHVTPNLWGAAVGRPGVMKSPAIRGPLKFLQRLEIAAKKQYAADVRQVRAGETGLRGEEKAAEGGDGEGCQEPQGPA